MEVGTGNGILLCELAKQGYDPTGLLGIDYSPGSIALSRKVAHNRGIENLTFQMMDFLSEDPLPGVFGMQDAIGSWDVLLDKGTFDAIALAREDSLGYAPVDLYPGRVVRLLRPGGLFLITCMLPPNHSHGHLSDARVKACNFTEDELKQRFITPETCLQYQCVPHNWVFYSSILHCLSSRIQHKTYTYGGKSGSICSSIAFQKPVTT